VPTIGKKWEKRYNQHDRGYTFSGQLYLDDKKLGDYNSNTSLQYASEKLDERKNYNASLGLEFNRTFYNETADTLNINIVKRKRDYYINAQGQIETREESINSLNNTLLYKMSDAMSFKTFSMISIGNIDIYSKTFGKDNSLRTREDFLLLNLFSFYFNSSFFKGKFDFLYSKEEQTYKYSSFGDDQYVHGIIPFDIPDNIKKRTGIALNLDGYYFSSDSLKIKMTIDKFQYDTPSKSNYDDRDEVHFDIELSETHVFNNNLSLNFLMGIKLNHLVYIYKERSADNNWNRVFRLKSTIRWNLLERLLFISEYEVLANYYDYDFENLLEGIRSFVFRRFFYRNYVQYRFSQNLSLTLGIRGEIEEHGKLIWDDFVQNLLNKRNTIALDSRILYKINKYLIISNGLSYFYRTDERPNLSSSRHSDRFQYFESNIGFIFKTAHNTELVLSGNRRLVKRTNMESKLFQDVDVSIRWYF